MGIKETCRGLFRLLGPRWSSVFPLSSAKSGALIGSTDKQVGPLLISLVYTRLGYPRGKRDNETHVDWSLATDTIQWSPKFSLGVGSGIV